MESQLFKDIVKDSSGVAPVFVASFSAMGKKLTFTIETDKEIYKKIL